MDGIWLGGSHPSRRRRRKRRNGDLRKREFGREKWEMLWLIPLMMKCYGLQVFIQELLASLIG